MIFTLDLIGSTIILACLWLLVMFSYMSGRMVKMGDPEDPHNNLMRPENDVNVCNYDFFGLGGTKNNSTKEIQCYVESKVHTQSKTLWKLCNHSLYDVLHEARNTKTLNIAVFIADINGTNRTTVWGDQQSNNLKSLLKQSTNEWRKVLHAGHPHDFRGQDHGIKICLVLQPGGGGGSQRYDAIAWGPAEDESHGLIDFATSGMAGVGFRSHHVNQLRDLNFHMSVVFENSDSNSTYGYVVRNNYMTNNNNFILGHCFTKGVTIYINDTMGVDLPYDPWIQYFIIVFFSCFVVCVALELIFFRRISLLLVTGSILVSAVTSYTSCNTFVKIPELPVVNGHPKRFSSDVFPVSLLTHELGHTLLMDDHYQVKMAASGSVVSTSLPGPTKPFTCPNMIPISVMGAENHITALDDAYVNAMWSMKQGRDYVYRSATGAELWRLKADAKAPLIQHTTRASTFIENFVSSNNISDATRDTCADQSLLPGIGGMNIRPQAMDNLPGDASTNDNTTLGPVCVTLGEIKDLFERSCAWNKSLKTYEPEAVCNPLKQKRVTLTGERYILHQYMNVYSFPIEFMFVIGLTFQFVNLWKKNENKNKKNIENTSVSSGVTHLHYRQLLDSYTVFAIVFYIVVVKVKSTNVARCVGVEDSIANWVDVIIMFLALPMLPLLARRIGLLKTDEVISGNSSTRLLTRDEKEKKRLKEKIKINNKITTTDMPPPSPSPLYETQVIRV